MSDFRTTAKQFEEKLRPIKMFLADCDGVMTPGLLFWEGQEVGWNRTFHALDGYAFKFLQSFGLKVGVISGGASVGLRRRLDNLGVDYQALGNEDKREGYLAIKEKSGFEDHQILYIGDELFDIPILRRVGFSATTPLASVEVQECVDYVTQRPPGQACLREVADILRYALGLYPHVPDFDGTSIFR